MSGKNLDIALTNTDRAQGYGIGTLDTERSDVSIYEHQSDLLRHSSDSLASNAVRRYSCFVGFKHFCSPLQ